MKLKPINRWILIESLEKKKKKKSSAVLVPDEFAETKERYEEYRVVSASVPYPQNIRPDCKIVVDNTMVEIIKVSGQQFLMILENHVVAVVDEEEDI